MREFDSFNAITRRALSINYRCPLICELIAESSGSGSGGSVTAMLDIDATLRKAGPATLTAEISGGSVTLTWSPQDYAFSYNVYLSSVSSAGPFTLETANLLSTNFILSLTSGTYYAKVTLVESDFGESFPSPIIQIIVT
jgi:hypothetical protein